MKKRLIERRELLRWVAFSCPPIIYLAGCGGVVSNAKPMIPTLAGTAVQPDPTDSPFECSDSSICKPLVMLYAYSGTSLVPTKSELPASLYNLTTTADRFDDGKLCYEFDGTRSLAVVRNIGEFTLGPFAISFWARSPNSAPVRAVAFVTGIKNVAAIELNNRCGLGVAWGNSASYRLTVGAAGEFTDGKWHHFLVQFDGLNLSAYVDGLLRGGIDASRLTDAQDLYIGKSGNLGWVGAIDDVRLHDRAFDSTYVPRMVYAWTQLKPATRNDSLIAYYPFEGDAVNDTGIGFDGTPFNVTPSSDRFGGAGRAYAFNGKDSYIELPTQLGPIQRGFCLAFWFQSSAQQVMTAFSVTRGVTPGSGDLNFVFNAGYALSVKLDGDTSTEIAIGSPGDLTDGAWHFAFLQLSGVTFQLYLDGVLKGEMQNGSSVLTSDSVIRFGRASGPSLVAENFWNGSLDDGQIYSTFNSSPFTPQEIVDLMQLQFRPRDGAGALVFQNKMWMLGGWNPANAHSANHEVWSSSDGANWTFVGNAPWERRHLAGWLVYHDRMWVVGGDANSGHYQNDVWSSADGINWVEESDSVPWANRATQYTVVFNGLMWLMGGQQLSLDAADPNPTSVAYNDVYSSPDGKSWTRVTPNAAWSPRGLIIGNVVLGGKMWVIGGGTYDFRTYLNDVWNSADGINWTQVAASAPWDGRQFHNVVVFDNKIWVIAGGTSQLEGGSTGVWYSTDGIVWAKLGGTPWVARHAASAWVYQNALWFANGSDAVAYDDVWKLAYAD